MPRGFPARKPPSRISRTQPDAHADRTRVIDDDHRKRVVTANLRVLATYLMDGRVGGTWRIERAETSAALVLEAFVPPSKKTRAELVEEGTSLLRFAETDARAVEVRWA